MKRTLLCFLVLALGSASVAAHAQAWPSQPIRLINPYAAGGPADLLAREVAKPLAESLGQQIVIEARPGGNSIVGGEFVAKARPDGYTLLLSGAPTHIIVPAMMAKAPYDGLKDFTPVAMVATVPNIVVAHPSRPYASITALIDYAKANPGKVTYGSAGNGSLGHLAGELLKARGGVNMVHVPYKGGAPAITDLLGGQIDLAIVNTSAVASHIASGKLRAVALATRARTALLPDLATVHESGVAALKDFDAGTWWAVFGPAGLPRHVVETLDRALQKATASPELKARLLQMQGAEVTYLGPEALAKHLRDENTTYAALIRSSGIKAE